MWLSPPPHPISLLQHPCQRQLQRQELQFVISARSLLGLTGAGMCLLSLATVGLSSVLSILKPLYLSVQEVASSQLRHESFELRGSEYTKSQKIKEITSFKVEKKKMIFKGGGRGMGPHLRWQFAFVLVEAWGKAESPAARSPHWLQR